MVLDLISSLDKSSLLLLFLLLFLLRVVDKKKKVGNEWEMKLIKVRMTDEFQHLS